MALQVSFRANGLLPAPLSQKIIQDSLFRTLLNLSTAIFKPEPIISQQEERVPAFRWEILASEVHLQKKPRRRAPKLLESERKRLKTEQESASPSIQKDVQDTSVQNILKPSMGTLNVNTFNREQRKMEQGPDMEMNEEVTVEVLVSGVSLQKSRNIQNNVSFKKSQAHQTNM